jgi:uncharacterized membrane protein
VSFDDWILALHVLSAFALVAGILLFWVFIVAMRRTDTPDGTIHLKPVVKVGKATVGIGAVGTLVLGIWLAFSAGGYDLWDGWIVAAILLWVIFAAIGRRSGNVFAQGMSRAQTLQTAGESGSNAELRALNRTSKGVLLHGLGSAVALLLLVDMIWKPGA